MNKEFQQELFVVFRKYNDSFTKLTISDKNLTFSISYTTDELDALKAFIKDLNTVSREIKIPISMTFWDKVNGEIKFKVK
jgi:predicted transport protein